MSNKEKRTRLKLIVNPSAGQSGHVKRDLNAVTRYLEANGFKVSPVLAKPKSMATPLARQAAEDGFEVVAAMGGDGTVEAVMRGLSDTEARLGIIPTGVQNRLARSLGIPLDLEGACRLIAGGHVHEMDVAQVKLGRSKWLPFFEMVGVGAVPALEPADEKAADSPDDELFRSQIAVSAEENAPHAIINLDDDRILEIETRLMTISNTPVFGKKFMVPAPDDLQHDGLLDISIYQGFSDADLQGYYPKIKAGYFAGSSNIKHLQSTWIKIRTTPSMHITADGVDLGHGTVSLRMRPGALKVIAPGEGHDTLGLPRGAYETAAAPALLAGDYFPGITG